MSINWCFHLVRKQLQIIWNDLDALCIRGCLSLSICYQYESSLKKYLQSFWLIRKLKFPIAKGSSQDFSHQFWVASSCHCLDNCTFHINNKINNFCIKIIKRLFSTNSSSNLSVRLFYFLVLVISFLLFCNLSSWHTALNVRQCRTSECF